MIARTAKQAIIVSEILRLAGQGSFLSIKELHDRMPYKCLYSSFRSSIRFLVLHEIVVTEKAGTRSIVKPTSKAFSLFTPGG